MTTMILAPDPIQRFVDSDGNALAGGMLFCYAAGTTTKQACFTSNTGGVALPNPIILNARGEVAPSSVGFSSGLWMDPTLAYKFVLAPAGSSDPPGATIWTVDNITSPAAAVLDALALYEAGLSGVPLGSMMPYGGLTPPTGWLLCYGQAISRTTYAALFAVIGTSYGAGDGSTTFNIPDKRGRASFGKDDMGGAAANRVTNAACGITGTTLGAAGGDQHAQADAGTVANTVATSITDPGHSHFITFGSAAGAAQLEITGGAPTVTDSLYTQNATTGILVNTTVASAFTSALSGGSQNMPPLTIDTWIIFATASVPPAGSVPLPNGEMWIGNGSDVAAAHFISGDGTIDNVGSLHVTHLNGGATIAASATIDTTNAANIASGTVAVARLPLFAGSTPGLVSTSPGGTAKFYRADSAWAVPPGSGGGTMDNFTVGTGLTGSAGALISNGDTITITDVTLIAHEWIDSIVSGVAHKSRPAAADITGLAASATIDTTNATNITSGTLASAHLPTPTAGAIGGIKALSTTPNFFLTGLDTSGALSSARPSAANVTGLAASATTDTTNAGNINSGTLAAARLPNTVPTAKTGAQSITSAANGQSWGSTDAGGVTWTASTGVAAGVEFTWFQGAAGVITFAPGSANILSAGGALTSNGQGAFGGFYSLGTWNGTPNTWLLVGNIA